MNQPPTIPPIVNSSMKLILRSPLHGMVSRSILLITFSGRRSGRSYTTPVSYSQADGKVYIFTHAEWWKNLRGGAPVQLRIRGKDYQGLAETVRGDKQAVAAGLGQHLKVVYSDARFYGVTFDEGGYPRVEDVQRAAQDVVMICVQLC